MKKLISIFVIALMIGTVSAQSTSPRWGSGPPTNDNTGRILTWSSITSVTSSTTAVGYQKPNAYNTTIKVGSIGTSFTDSLSTTNAYLGDVVNFVFTNGSTAAQVITFGNNIKSVGTLTVSGSKKATAGFIFDGTNWIELCRSVMGN